MKRALIVLISFYPKAWRARYRNEFEALLDDVSPTWRTLLDVFGGALKMQLKTWTSWKIVAACALLGLVAALLFTLTIPRRYVSQAIMKVEPGTSPQALGALVQKALGRASLVEIINKENLYGDERRRIPIEDLVEQMKARDIAIEKTGNDTFLVSFAALDPARAPAAGGILAGRFLELKAATILDPASLPARPVSPRPSRNILVGLIAGALAGVLIALFRGLKIWKLAAALGMAGAVFGGAASFLFPERYTSTAVVLYEGGDGFAMRDLIGVVLSPARYGFLATQFGLYTGDPRAESKVREHLHIEPINHATAVRIAFEYSDPHLAQKVAQDVVWRLIEENLGKPSGMTIEMLDPAGLPMSPIFPNRSMAAGTGLFLGLGCAVLLGVWRLRRGPLPLVAAR